MKGCLLLLCFLGVGFITYAQEEVFLWDSAAVSGSTEATLLVEPSELETTKVYQRQEVKKQPFDEDEWRQIVGETSYEEAAWKKESVQSKPMSLAWNSPWVSIIFYVLVGTFVLVVLYFILRNISFDLKRKPKYQEQPDPEQAVEDIESLDIQRMLAEAIGAGNFRLAVRLYYLSLLKQLNERGLISWKKDKTNRDYLAELFSKDHFFDDVRKLTYSYESVWYGEHDVRRENFDRLSAQFERVITKINDAGR